MTRLGTLGLLLLLLFSPSLSPAQTTVRQPPGSAAGATFGPLNFADRDVPGESVVDLADAVCEYLAEATAVPDFLQVQTASGRLRRISAAEAFVLLARTAYLWQVAGQLPETIPLAPEDIRAPVVDPEDLPDTEPSLDAGRHIPTDQFLAQCAATVRWIDRLHVVPTAVWVEGERLSAGEYLAGLAVCLSYAYWEGELYDHILLIKYAPPRSWVRDLAIPTDEGRDVGEAETDSPWEIPASGEAFQEEASGEGLLPVSPPLLPARAEPAPAAFLARPHLTIFPEPGSTLSGSADLVASYTGPPARFVIFDVHGAARVITNVPPYSYRWDTSALSPGVYAVRVKVLGDEDVVLADMMSTFNVVPPQAEGRREDLADDL